MKKEKKPPPIDIVKGNGKWEVDFPLAVSNSAHVISAKEKIERALNENPKHFFMLEQVDGKGWLFLMPFDLLTDEEIKALGLAWYNFGTKGK